MCGIIAYVGRKVAQPLLIEGLKRLEYRGYDSAGIAVIDGRGAAHSPGGGANQRPGKFALRNGMRFRRPHRHGPYPLGDARRAHGSQCPSPRHETGLIAMVHNGIIENYVALKKFLTEKGQHFPARLIRKFWRC